MIFKSDFFRKINLPYRSILWLFAIYPLSSCHHWGLLRMFTPPIESLLRFFEYLIFRIYIPSLSKFQNKNSGLHYFFWRYGAFRTVNYQSFLIQGIMAIGLKLKLFLFKINRIKIIIKKVPNSSTKLIF